MELDRRAKSVAEWLNGLFLFTVACLCLLPAVAMAQGDASSSAAAVKKSSTPKTTDRKTASSRAHRKPTPSASKSGSSAATKNHSTSHPAAGNHSHSGSTAVALNGTSKHPGTKKSTGKKTTRGQQKIEPERAEAIQEALIREHYMTGEPARTWNQASEDALRRYQANHGWQSKTVPDSRALISLGLGPSHDHLLNPESAMTTGPDVSHSASASSSTQIPVSHSAEPGARMSTNPVAPADSVPVATPDPKDASSPQ